MSCCDVNTLGGVPVGVSAQPGMALERMVEDFTQEGFASNRTTGWLRITGNGGTVTMNSATGPQDARHPGVCMLGLDMANVGGASSSLLSRSIRVLACGDGALTIDMIYQLVVLPDGTDDFFAFLGESDLNTGLPADGFGFVFDRTISTTNWLIVSRAGAVGVPIDTGVAAVAGTWMRFRAVVNATRTAVDFFMDANAGAGLVSVGTFAATIPSVGALFAPNIHLLEIAGAAAVQDVAAIDLYIQEKDIVPARP